MTLKREEICWSIYGDFIHRHHIEPRVQFYVPKDERKKKPFLFHRNTLMSQGQHVQIWTLHKKKRLDDHWNVDGNNNLSDPWTGFTKFTLLKETPPKGYMWSGKRLTNIQTSARPDHMWPQEWSKIGKAAQKNEKQEWAIEKPKLENARKLRGIYSIGPDDEKYKDIIKNPWRKLETSMADPMPCKGSTSSRVTGAVNIRRAKTSEKIPKTRFNCIVEAHESTRPRMESVKKKNHEDHIAGKGHNSILHPMPQVMKIPDAKVAVDEERKKLETVPAWPLEKVKSKKEVSKEAQNK